MALLSSRSDGRDYAKGALSQMLREINGLKNRKQGDPLNQKRRLPLTDASPRPRVTDPMRQPRPGQQVQENDRHLRWPLETVLQRKRAKERVQNPAKASPPYGGGNRPLSEQGTQQPTHHISWAIRLVTTPANSTTRSLAWLMRRQRTQP